MIIAYLAEQNFKPIEVNQDNLTLLRQALWIDLLNPTKDEERLVESITTLEVPTREEMHEIEFSSRLYRLNGTLFMTASMLAQFDSTAPQYDAVTFVLTKQQLITIRYIEPLAFKMLKASLPKLDGTISPARLFIELLEASIDRLADILEIIGQRLDKASTSIFQNTAKPSYTASKIDYQQLLVQIGLNGDYNSKAFQSLMAFTRLITYFTQNATLPPEEQARAAVLSHDIISLNDHAAFHSNKVNFLLDATLGLVSIEQNLIIKIFSVAAVIFLPPTLIASIYGMNFKVIPELSWHYGYLFAIGLMIMSAWLPYKFFKRKKWL